MSEQRPSNKTVNETGKEARQGPLGKPVLLVLIGGLLLAAIAWGGAEIFGESTDNSATITEQENPASGQNQPSDPTSPQSGDEPAINPPSENARPQSGSGGETQTNPPSGAAQ